MGVTTRPRRGRRRPRVAAAVLRRLALTPRLRLRLALVLAACALGALAYLGWLRDSSLVAVERVTVTGLTTPDAARIEAALAVAAKDMTTLHVRAGELEEAVAAFPVVRAVEPDADFPHGLAIRVVEHRPVAAVAVPGGDRVAVAADGTVLPELPAERLPHVAASSGVAGKRLGDAAARRLVAVLGAAPRPLLERVERIGVTRTRGIVIALRDGPELVFGDDSRARAKWTAAAAVLADSSSAGAAYVDVRLPERPAAGGVGAPTIEPLDPAGQPPAGQDAPPSGNAAPGAAPPAEADPQPQLEP